MKTLICATAAIALASLAPVPALAADLGGYEDRDTYIERPARVIERERVIVERPARIIERERVIVQRHYYEPLYVEEPVVRYYRPRRVYYASDYSYRFAPRFHYHPHYNGRHYRRW